MVMLGFLLWGCYGSDVRQNLLIPPHRVYLAKDMSDFLARVWETSSQACAADVVELCGGEHSFTSRLCVCRRLNMGRSFDIVTGCDLNSASDQRAVEQYYDIAKPLVQICSPMCRPFGNLGRANRTLHPEAWERSYQQAAPHGRFVGKLALKQINAGRFFLNEQPHPSDLYKEEPWPEVLQHCLGIVC